jgi:hypothetical protein
MKQFLSLIILLSIFQRSYATSIGVGYNSKDVIVWRFWAINKHGIPEAKILVCNTSNAPVSFCLTKTNIRGKLDSFSKMQLQRISNLANDTIVMPSIIKPHKHAIFDIVSLTNSGFYDAIFVNGECCGIEDDLRWLPRQKFVHKYYSYDGIAGSQSWLTGKDRLFSRRGRNDKMTLYFDYSTIKNDSYLKYMKVQIEHVSGINKGFAQTEQWGRYTFDASSKDVDLHVNVEQRQVFEVTLNFTVTKKGEMPVLDMREVFAGGCSGVRLPVFAQ